jgi:DNA-binding IclR family transcriptional regulator
MSGVERGLMVLEQLAGSESSLSHSDLVRATGLPKSTLTNVLTELRALGYVTTVGRGYTMGPRVAALGYRVLRQAHLPPDAPEGMSELLHRLADETGETAVFSVEIGRTPELAGEVIALDHAESPHAVRYVPGLGEPQAVADTAAGYALLAFTGRDASAIPPRSKRSSAAPTTAPEIDAELTRTRRRGYARSLHQGPTAVGSLAVVWPKPGPDAGGAISIVGPTERIERTERSVAATLRALADQPALR